MKDLVDYMVRAVVTHPDAVAVEQSDGDASVLLELRVHPDDAARLRDAGLLKAMQMVVNAASGSRKAVLDLVDDGGAPSAP